MNTNTWDRQAERRKLWKHFKRKENVSMSGPRRVGKTHLMSLIEQESNALGYVAIKVDLSAATTPQQATIKLAEKIQTSQGAQGVWKQVLTRMTDLFQGDTDAKTLTEAMIKTDWSRLLKNLIEGLNDQETPCLLLIDEISVCLSSCLAKNEHSGAELLHELRTLRQDYPNVRWLLTGSLGLNNIAEAYHLSGCLNNLEPFSLEPLTPEQARDYCNHLCQQYSLSLPDEQTHQYLQQRLCWLSPHYLKRIIDQVEDVLEAKNSKKFDVKAVEEACTQLLKHPFNQLFADWPDHINRNYPDGTDRVANHLLVELCVDEQGMTIDTLHNKIKKTDKQIIKATLRYLVEDGYLVLDESNHRYRFIFGLLREYWQKVFS